MAKKAINKTMYEQAIRDSVKIFQEAIEYKDVPLHCFDIFMAISEKTAPTTEDVKKLFPKISHAAVSRTIHMLTGQSSVRKDGGFPLLEYIPDPVDRRYKHIHLTEKGKQVRDSIHAHGTRWINEAIS